MKNYIMVDGKKIELSEETVKNIRGEMQEPKIMAPDFVTDTTIYFNESRQMLYSSGAGLYSVNNSYVNEDEDEEFQLIPCEKEDLEEGDVVFYTYLQPTKTDFVEKVNHINNYFIILKDVLCDMKNVSVTSEGNIEIAEMWNWVDTNFYKVVKIKEKK